MKYKKKQHEEVKPNIREINVTSTDRITYLYKRDARGNIIEVTNVSYEILVQKEWVTVVRYDSSHGYLHRHIRVSMENFTDTPTTLGVKKKGSHTRWLTWAIDDIKNRFDMYRRRFLKRSKIKDIDTDV